MQRWGLLLGTNQISNCGAALVIDGVDVFRLRSSETDNQILVDFDIYGQDRTRLARVAKNQVVYAAEGYATSATSSSCEVTGPSGEVLARVEKVAPGWLKINGIFWSHGLGFPSQMSTCRSMIFHHKREMYQVETEKEWYSVLRKVEFRAFDSRRSLLQNLNSHI